MTSAPTTDIRGGTTKAMPDSGLSPISNDHDSVLVIQQVKAGFW